MSIYNLEVKTAQGKTETLSQYRGDVLLIVNVASQCGFTPQYDGLQSLYQKYKDQGFSVLGFPCNQFGNQEPGTDSEIQSFCESRFHIKFPIYSKIDVNGSHASPLFEYLKSEAKGLLGSEMIKWNFTKFLVDRNGKVVKRFAPQTEPKDLEAEIEKLLKAVV